MIHKHNRNNPLYLLGCCLILELKRRQMKSYQKAYMLILCLYPQEPQACTNTNYQVNQRESHRQYTAQFRPTSHNENSTKH